MTPAVAQILEEAERLTAPERAELVDCIIDEFAHNIPLEIERAHITEVRRRIAEVESGKVSLIPGDEALAQVRRLLSSARVSA